MKNRIKQWLKAHLKHEVQWLKDHVEFEEIFNRNLVEVGIQIEGGSFPCIAVLLGRWSLTIYFD